MLEALRAGRPLNKILIARDIGRHSAIGSIIHLAGQGGVVVEHVQRAAIDRLSVTGLSQGVLAQASVKEYAVLEDLLKLPASRGEPALLVILDGVEDPHNLGAVIRSADGAGAHGVVIPERRAAGLTAAVARSSAGAIEYVPVARTVNVAQSLARLGKAGLWTVGIDAEAETEFTEVDLVQPTAIVIGGEGKGLSRLVRERCDILASIPMRGKVTSLNASVAAALVLYEALRQRRASPPRQANLAG